LPPCAAMPRQQIAFHLYFIYFIDWNILRHADSWYFIFIALAFILLMNRAIADIASFIFQWYFLSARRWYRH
jgi:hypothetical protein